MSSAASLPRTHHTELGFTLLEMLVVLAITGLIAGLVYPQIATARFEVRQRLVREQVAAAVDAARAAALRSGAPVSLSADSAAGALVIAGTRRITVDPANQLKLDLRPRIITFYPDGSTTGGQLTLGAGREASAITVSRTGAQALAAAPVGTGG